ncbi:MAG: hypothetical protein V1780_00530 [Chloroflexota bacterium]
MPAYGDKGSLIYETGSRYDRWQKPVVAGILAMTFIPGVVLLPTDRAAGLYLLGLTLFDALLFKAIIPRRFQLYEHRLRIELGGPFAINIRLANIRAARLAPGRKSWVYSGVRLATSSSYVVEIVLHRGLSLVISPADDTFLEQLNRRLAAISG